jgi:hypothetical protein
MRHFFESQCAEYCQEFVGGSGLAQLRFDLRCDLKIYAALARQHFHALDRDIAAEQLEHVIFGERALAEAEFVQLRGSSRRKEATR